MAWAAATLRAARLAVIRGGRVIASTAPATVKLDLPGRPAATSFQLG